MVPTNAVNVTHAGSNFQLQAICSNIFAFIPEKGRSNATNVRNAISDWMSYVDMNEFTPAKGLSNAMSAENVSLEKIA